MRDLQVNTLKAILERVRNCPDAVVEIDLDLTALMPVVRTQRSLQMTAKKTGVREFADPARLPVLPGYSPEAWAAFLTKTGIPARYPALSWYVAGKPDRSEGTPYGCFHSGYWNTELLIEDEPAPGLCAWVHRIESLGGRVVFLSGRWLREHEGPTRACLHRSGIPLPLLVIGNDRHETLVDDPKCALSDAAIKAARQAEIRERFGEPVAFVDDRPSNRAAVLAAAGSSLLTVAITIPGFTYDPGNEADPLRISTFELFDDVLGDPPRHTYLLARYGPLGAGHPWDGLYEGLGANNQAYVVRRGSLADDTAWKPRLTSSPPYSHVLAEWGQSALTEREFVALCEHTIPTNVLTAARQAMREAARMADIGLAAAFPRSAAQEESLYHALLASWLHSRDIETIMRSLGFPLAATGVHDVQEFAPADEVKARILHGGREEYSSWLLAWAEDLQAGSDVNVGCFDPALAVGMWEWRPETKKEDAMDVHRLSSHHEGDGNERYDPIEAVVNNLLHRREGVSGIRKEPVESWALLFERMLLPSGAFALGKTGLAPCLYRDLLNLAPNLERQGFITPWCVVEHGRGQERA